jgi:hypothetical protein
MENKKVVVKWRDAKIYPGMHSEAEALEHEMEIFESLGYLLRQDDRATVIAHEVTDTGNIARGLAWTIEMIFYKPFS